MSGMRVTTRKLKRADYNLLTDVKKLVRNNVVMAPMWLKPALSIPHRPNNFRSEKGKKGIRRIEFPEDKLLLKAYVEARRTNPKLGDLAVNRTFETITRQRQAKVVLDGNREVVEEHESSDPLHNTQLLLREQRVYEIENFVQARRAAAYERIIARKDYREIIKGKLIELMQVTRPAKVTLAHLQSMDLAPTTLDLEEFLLQNPEFQNAFEPKILSKLSAIEEEQELNSGPTYADPDEKLFLLDGVTLETQKKARAVYDIEFPEDVVSRSVRSYATALGGAKTRQNVVVKKGSQPYSMELLLSNLDDDDAILADAVQLSQPGDAFPTGGDGSSVDGGLTSTAMSRLSKMTTAPKDEEEESIAEQEYDPQKEAAEAKKKLEEYKRKKRARLTKK